MASLETQGDGWYRIVVRCGGEKFQRALDTQDAKEAGEAKSRVEENLRRLRDGWLKYTPDDDFVTLLLTGGKLANAPAVVERATLAEFITKYQADRPPGKEASTSYTEDIHFAHLLRLIGGKTSLADIDLALLQRYINARSLEGGRRGPHGEPRHGQEGTRDLHRCLEQVGVTHRLVTNPLSIRHLDYPAPRDKPPFETWEQIERKTKLAPCGG